MKNKNEAAAVTDGKRERARMKPPKIDRASRVLIEKVAAMSNSERAKLDRLLINVELLGDVAKAVGQVGVSKQLLDKWMNTREIAWVIDQALIRAERIAKGKDEEGLLWGADPERQSGSLFRAKLASKNLKAAKNVIQHAAELNDKRFFIDLGKCLSGEIDSTVVDPLDGTMAGLLTRYPSITAKDAVDYLTKLGYKLTEDGFRMRKKRLRLKFLTIHDYFAPSRELHALAARLGVPA